MIKDRLFKTVSIPLLGVLIPLLSQLIDYRLLSWQEVILSNAFFITVSFAVWQGAVYSVSRGRRLQWVKQKPFLKLTMLCLSTAIYGFIISGLAAGLWQRVLLNIFDAEPVLNCALICAGTVIFLTLVYEVLFLSKERELDVRIVDQLDKERLYAELNSLKSELDPHFVFNSLTTLSHLISVDTDKAQTFINKLAQVYKYLLMNKDRELISLNDELKFIDDYFFLLRIRYDDKVKLSLAISDYTEKIMILPCSLQLLVENAIKHNQFTNKDHLHISVTKEEEYLRVENNVMMKQYAMDSTRIGLNNLSNRYRLLYQKDIVVQKTDRSFAVKIPLIKQSSL